MPCLSIGPPHIYYLHPQYHTYSILLPTPIKPQKKININWVTNILTKTIQNQNTTTNKSKRNSHFSAKVRFLNFLYLSTHTFCIIKIQHAFHVSSILLFIFLLLIFLFFLWFCVCLNVFDLIFLWWNWNLCFFYFFLFLGVFLLLCCWNYFCLLFVRILEASIIVRFKLNNHLNWIILMYALFIYIYLYDMICYELWSFWCLFSLLEYLVGWCIQLLEGRLGSHYLCNQGDFFFSYFS
jgi:hypothetical protein